ncbi:hypothetical protein [Lactococcus lactis]|jgi:hypothetical protein|uniref:hypothetical protein n=1 Tax=Lactococcus lactis TaxID=1358 RepID=UPI00071C34B8|nr:hypothetical protein [Lactococcus lactis]KSU15120.1 hypothetical protein LMG9446_0883 [Lactococcus lactis subsp. lactis]MCT0054005.1 hypothetical protein [Lactococcus lactis subsp. lactis]
MDNKQNNSSSGIGVVAAFIVTGIAIPLLFSNFVMMLVGTFIVAFGIAGFGVELDKIYGGKDYTSMFLGGAILLGGTVLTILLPNIVTKSLLIVLLALGVFGLISGIVKSIPQNTEIDYKKDKKSRAMTKSSFFLIISIIVGMTGFTANVFTILAFFK